MAGFFGRIFGPRQAKNALTNANTQTLRNALKNYINAVNKLNVKNNAHIRGLLMAKKNGSNISYKNRLVNGISNIVVASRAAKLAVGAANAGMVPETAAANVVNNAANQVRRNQAGFNALPGNNAAAPVPKNKKNNVNLNASSLFKQANKKANNVNLNASNMFKQANNKKNNVNQAGFNALPGNNAAAPVPNKKKNNVNLNASNLFKQANNQAGFNALPGNNAAAPVPKNKKNNVNLNASNMFKQANKPRRVPKYLNRERKAGFNALPGNNAAAPVPKNKKNNVNLNASNMFKQANNKKN